MMHLYFALLCIAVHPKHFTIMWRGGGLLNHHQCAASTWMMRRLPQDNGASALTTHQLQVESRERVIEPIKCMRSPHTSYRWRERERVIEIIKCSAHHTPATGGERESHRDNQVYALTTHQLQVERRESHRANQVYALTTHQLQGRGERVIEIIKCMRSPHTSYR